ncbi:MAG: glycosyltransferase family 4 protein [Candidatus Omnitrophota bacterium]|nr:glycosyltransferase family 4 protein [Candidatus Omnitrophota bacterium]
MNICFITPEFVTEPYYAGGISQLFYRIARWLAAQGHCVHVIVCAKANEDFQYQGIHMHRLAIKHVGLVKALNYFSFGRLRGALYWLVYSFDVYRYLRKLNFLEHFDIIESVNYHIPGLFALIFLKVPHISFAGSYQAVWTSVMRAKLTMDLKMQNLLEALYLRLSKHLYISSECAKNMIVKDLKINNIKVIRPVFYQEVTSLDDSIYKERLEGKPYLLFVGQMRLHKGVHILAQSLPQVFEKFPEAHAVFVGSDTKTPLGPSIREYIRSQNSAYRDRLVFIDACPKEKLYPLYQHARLVVLPSLVDDLPITLIEVMGFARPIIGTIDASFDEVLEEGKDGFLVPLGNPKALAEKICEVWPRQDLEKIGEAAKHKSEEFAPEKTVQTLLDYYEEVIKGMNRKNEAPRAKARGFSQTLRTEQLVPTISSGKSLPRPNVGADHASIHPDVTSGLVLSRRDKRILFLPISSIQTAGTRFKVYFIVSKPWGSASMSGDQISDQLSKYNIQSTVVNIQEGYERIKGIRESIIIFIKFIDNIALDIFRRNNNVIIWHIVDELCFNANMENANIVDGVIVPNKHTELEYKEKFKTTQFVAIYEHRDPRWQFNNADRYSLVYIGSDYSENIAREYLSIRELKIKFIDAKTDGAKYDLFKIPLKYSCHFSVRKENSVVFKYKPCTKIAAAAATNSNIVLSKDYSNIELLDSSYPYYTASDLKSVKEIVNYSKETYASTVWNKGLAMMAEVREKTSVETTTKSYIEFFKRF